MKMLNESFDRNAFEVELNNLLEAMSPEDAEDTKLIRSVLLKIRARRNAALTKEEKAVLAKYGIHNNGYGQLFVTSKYDPSGHYKRSEIKLPEEESPMHGKKYWDRKNNPGEVNLADIARKRGQRFDNSVYMTDTYGNVRVMANPGRRGVKTSDRNDVYDSFWGGDDTTQENHRRAQSILMRNDLINLTSYLKNRKSAQNTLDTVDAEYDKRDEEAAKKYMDTLASNERSRTYAKSSANSSLNLANREIADLLASKRKPKVEEALTEDAYLDGPLYKISHYCLDIEELLTYVENLVDKKELLFQDAERILEILRNTFNELEDTLADINKVE